MRRPPARPLARFGVLALPVLLLALHRIDSPDIWFHVATGRWIVEHGSVPAHDPFGAVPPPAPWINLVWLADVILYGLDRLGGTPALVVATALLALAALLLPWLWARRQRLGPTAPYEWALLLAAPIAAERFFVGPEMFTVLFVTLYVQVLRRGLPAGARGLAGLVAAQALWANLHAAFGLGPVLGGLAVLGDVIDRRLVHRPARRPAWVAVALVPALVLAACVTPWGPRAWLPLLRAGRELGTPAFRGGISEWQPTFAATPIGDWVLLCFVASLGFVAAAAWIGRRTLRGFDGLALVAFLGLALGSRRHLLLWAVAVLPLAAGWMAAARAVAPAVPRRWPRLQAGLAAAAGAVPLAVALLLAFDVASGRYARRFGPPRQLGWGVSSLDHPIGAAEFVARHGLEGPLFNNIAAGSYLIGRFGERLPVFVDGRLLDPAHFRLYRELLGSPAAFEPYAEAHGLRLVVLALQPHAPVGLFRHLYGARHWQLVYFDGEGAVFVHRAAPRAATLPELRLEAALAPVPAAGAGAALWRWRVCDPGEAAVRGSMLLGLGFPQAARADLTQALLRCTERWDVGLELSTALIAVGRSREARPLVERALRHDPAHAGAWVNLGLCYAAAGDSLQARDAWRRARALQPSDPRAAALLGEPPGPARAP